MKALAVDSAVSRLTITAKNDDKTCTAIYSIGMKQSETIVPAIDYVLSKTDLTTKNLDYLTLTSGPGSFTGLRLSFSALKAIELATGKPLYGLSSLKAYAEPYIEFDYPVLSCIDANKDRFYAGIYSKDGMLLEDGDYSVEELINKVSSIRNLVIAGPDNQKFKDLLKAANASIQIIAPQCQPVTTETLFKLTEEEIKKGAAPLQDYDGPVYLRASEAEIVHSQKNF